MRAPEALRELVEAYLGDLALTVERGRMHSRPCARSNALQDRGGVRYWQVACSTKVSVVQVPSGARWPDNQTQVGHLSAVLISTLLPGP